MKRKAPSSAFLSGVLKAHKLRERVSDLEIKTLSPLVSEEDMARAERALLAYERLIAGARRGGQSRSARKIRASRKSIKKAHAATRGKKRKKRQLTLDLRP
jgi:hypothetical protein